MNLQKAYSYTPVGFAFSKSKEAIQNIGFKTASSIQEVKQDVKDYASLPASVVTGITGELGSGVKQLGADARDTINNVTDTLPYAGYNLGKGIRNAVGEGIGGGIQDVGTGAGVGINNLAKSLIIPAIIGIVILMGFQLTKKI